MPECSEIGLRLGAAGDGELEPGNMREIARHLTRCADCTVQLSDYVKIGRELKAIAITPSLEGFTKTVLAAIKTLIVVAIFAMALYGPVARLEPTTIARDLPQTVAGTSPASSTATTPIRMVTVQIDSAMVGDQAFGIFSHTNLRTQSGKMLVVRLSGGRTLHLQPRVIDGDTIKLEVILFDRGRPTMRSDLNLENGSSVTLSGEQFTKGTLLLRISPIASSIGVRDPKLL
jgi:hypothetical protein